MKFRIALVSLLTVLFMALPTAAYAQESTLEPTATATEVLDLTPTPEPPPVVTDPPVVPDPGLVQDELAAALAAIVILLSNLTFLPIAAPFVVAVTALIKKFGPSSWNPAIVALVVQILTWVAYIVAKYLGYETQFNSWVGILATIAGALGGIVLSSLVTEKIYDSLSKNDVPFFGTSQADMKKSMG